MFTDKSNNEPKLLSIQKQILGNKATIFINLKCPDPRYVKCGYKVLRYTYSSSIRYLHWWKLLDEQLCFSVTLVK